MGFCVTMEPSGRRFDCGPTNTVLSAALAAGIFLPYSCRAGVCNTCRGKIVEGNVDLGAVHPAHLSDADRAAGYALLCQARPISDLVVRARELDASEAMGPKTLPSRVLSMERRAPDVMVVKLGMPANEPVVFMAGQYLEVQLPGGLTRSYSMANVPGSEGVRQLELHIRHLPGGQFTEHIFHKTKVRDMWKVEVPLGTFYWREKSEKPIVMVASGTGFAPIKAIIEHSIAKGFERPIALYWGGRQAADLYMSELAEGWAREHAHIQFVPVLSEAGAQTGWRGRTGFVHHAVMQDFPDLGSHQVYACGAPIVVDSARRDFTERCNLPAEEFFADSFITAADRARAAG
ncbi:MAG: CDP-6-deoxy-delta-3,4-glucoseen reductase [Ramlibacter sp.]|nr:CDP-6-deoxy-delta-3,4-glucoseen reductase [Ramlibacter sp.]